MNKILLTLLCLLTISVFAGTTFASNDATEILNNDYIQISENTKMDISISEDREISENTKNDISNSQSNQTNQATTTFYDVNNSYTPNNNDLKPSASLNAIGGSFGKNPECCPICKLNNTDPNNPSDIVGRATEFNNTNSNSNNSSDIGGPSNGSKLDIKGPKDPKGSLDIKGPKGPKLNTTQIELLKLNAILKKHKNETLIMKLQNTSDGRQVIALYTTSSGLNGAGSSYVGEVGTELVDILEKEGVFKKMAYGTVWGISKIGELFGGNELSDNEIWFLATGNLSPSIGMWWDDLTDDISEGWDEFTDDIGDWWDDLWD
ncbi:hypothetical protein [Methanobrevibacter sp.]|uniref:hypothetical protein n=1 Tax=Methanobrevibacter sp. TaxID=66852 RepID=UPI00389024E9